MYDLLVPNSVSYTETHPTSSRRNRFNDNTPRQELSILRIVQERLTTLGLAQLPPAAITFLAGNLASQVRIQAARTITARSVARAILAASSSSRSASPDSKEESQNLSPKA